MNRHEQELATRRVEAFRRRAGADGDAKLALACHAAVPLALTPDLVHRLWWQFRTDVHGRELRIPWVAVADLLLSALCREVGHELYEMWPAVRAELLERLERDPRLGARRRDDIAEFLRGYVVADLASADPDVRDLARAQRLAALSYLEPERVARELAEALGTAGAHGVAEQGRIAALVESLSGPLPDGARLAAVARLVGDAARGLAPEVPEELQAETRTGRLVVGGVTVRLPGATRSAMPSRPRRRDRIGSVLVITHWRPIFATLARELGVRGWEEKSAFRGRLARRSGVWELDVRHLDWRQREGIAERVAEIVAKVNPLHVFILHLAAGGLDIGTGSVVVGERLVVVRPTASSQPTVERELPGVWAQRVSEMETGVAPRGIYRGNVALLPPTEEVSAETLETLTASTTPPLAVVTTGDYLGEVADACAWSERLMAFGIVDNLGRPGPESEQAKYGAAARAVSEFALGFLPEREDLRTQPADPTAWGLWRLGVPQLWWEGYAGRGQRIGLLDTGVDGQHPALRGAVKYFASAREGEVSTGLPPTDPSGHGTRTAGMLVGRRVGRMMTGVAPEAVLAMASVGENVFSDFNIARGLLWAAKKKVRVICIPLGSARRPESTLWQNLIEDARASGILLVCPSGNDGPGRSSEPGNQPGVLSVGWTDREDRVHHLSSSERFERERQPVVPSLVAPGVDIGCTPPGDGFETLTGATAACALVAGLAALLFQAQPDATVDEVEAALLESCELPSGMEPERGGRGIPFGPRALEQLQRRRRRRRP